MRLIRNSCVGAALAWMLGANMLHAQSLSLSPAVVPLKGTFGQTTTQVLTLQNGTDLPLDFTLEARDVVVRSGVRAFVEAGALPGSIAATAVFTPRQLHLSAHSSATVSLTLTMPPATQQRAVVALFQGRTMVSSGSQQARLSLGALFTFTLSDKVSLAASALELRPPAASANAQIRSTLYNDGEEPVVPSGMAVILDAAGRIVGKTPFAPRRLLPGEKATVSAEYQGELSTGEYRTVATFDVEGRPMTLAGMFTVP
jgi:hypothetical protein